MKTSFISSIRAWGIAALAAMCVFAFPVNSDARDHRHHGHHYSRVHRGHHHHHYPRYRSHRVIRSPYYSYPRSSGFVITLGNGYAGRGYYYGPPRRSYYSRQPGVVYYSRRGLVPSRYW